MEQKKVKHIVCLALPAWEAEYLRSTVELMKGLSQHNLVLYVDYAYTISDFIKGLFGKKKFDWKRLIGLKPRLRKINGSADTGIFVLSLPPVLPSFRFKSHSLFQLANRFNALISGYFINRAIKKLKMKDVITFNSFQPFLGRFWKVQGEVFNVYYVYDDFTKVPWFNGFVVDEERQYLNKVDLIIVSSQELKRRYTVVGKPVEVVNNGVHFKSFFYNKDAKKLNQEYIKTVGYTGTIDNRLDPHILEYVIREMPSTRFLFIGKVGDKAIYNRLIKYINVCFDPPVTSEMVPTVQSQIHVGIIPYLCNELTSAIYPLKVNEYLAMGLPVVMTPFASVGEADEVVYTARGLKDFKHCLELALLETDPDLKSRRIAIAQKADWGERVATLTNIINAHQHSKVLYTNLVKV